MGAKAAAEAFRRVCGSGVWVRVWVAELRAVVEVVLGPEVVGVEMRWRGRGQRMRSSGAIVEDFRVVST